MLPKALLDHLYLYIYKVKQLYLCFVLFSDGIQKGTAATTEIEDRRPQTICTFSLCNLPKQL